jgi:hypothetical protein
VIGKERPNGLADFIESGGKWIIRGLLIAGAFTFLSRRRRKLMAEMELPMPMSGLAPAASGDELNPEAA